MVFHCFYYEFLYITPHTIDVFLVGMHDISFFPKSSSLMPLMLSFFHRKMVLLCGLGRVMCVAKYWSTTSWSLLPSGGMVLHRLTCPWCDVSSRSKMLFPLVSISTTCCRFRSAVICMKALFTSLVVCEPLIVYCKLKSPPSMKV